MLPSSGKSKNITSFMDLLEKSKNLTDTKGTVWSDVVCRIRGLKLNLNKGTYLSCPACKKKVHEEFDHVCESCNEKYERAKYRYILNVNLVDGEEQIWVSAYDAIGEKLLAIEGEDVLTADAFMRMTEDELSARIK
jgi:replication factor A1